VVRKGRWPGAGPPPGPVAAAGAGVQADVGGGMTTSGRQGLVLAVHILQRGTSHSLACKISQKQQEKKKKRTYSIFFFPISEVWYIEGSSAWRCTA